VSAESADAVEHVVAAVREGDPGSESLRLHPYLHWQDGATSIRGRTRVLSHLAGLRELATPAFVELRDGQIYRWIAEAPEATERTDGDGRDFGAAAPRR
jgi:hypothetical protein